MEESIKKKNNHNMYQAIRYTLQEREDLESKNRLKILEAMSFEDFCDFYFGNLTDILFERIQ